MPVVGEWAIFGQSRALFTLGLRLMEFYRRAAYFVDRILKRSKARRCPDRAADCVRAGLQVKTAKTLGITVPWSLLLRADEVIQS